MQPHPILRGRGTPLEPVPDQPFGYCQCGCGQQTAPAGKTRPGRGLVKGQPTRFCSGHGKINRGPLAEIRDCGYETPCWVWLGARNGRYGETGSRWVGTRSLAHRVVYEVLVGSIPDGLTIDHLCANTLCCNPDHLEPVSLAENTRRQWADGRARPNQRQATKTHCIRGHEFTPENTLVSCGRRRCRQCARDR